MTTGWDIVESTDISSHFGGVTFFCKKCHFRGTPHGVAAIRTFVLNGIFLHFSVLSILMWNDSIILQEPACIRTTSSEKKRKINTSMMPQEYPANIWLLLGEVLDLVELNISAGHMAQPVMMRLVQTKRRFCVSTVPRDGVGEDSNSKCRSTLLLPVQERKPARWSCGLGHRAWINSITNAVLVRVWCHDPLLCQVGWFKF